MSSFLQPCSRVSYLVEDLTSFAGLKFKKATTTVQYGRQDDQLRLESEWHSGLGVVWIDLGLRTASTNGSSQTEKQDGNAIAAITRRLSDISIVHTAKAYRMRVDAELSWAFVYQKEKGEKE